MGPGSTKRDAAETAGLDRLPERIRRWQRFGGADAAAVAEAEALGREIDALAMRLVRATAAPPPQGLRPSSEKTRSGDAQTALLALRAAGLAVHDEVERLASWTSATD